MSTAVIAPVNPMSADGKETVMNVMRRDRANFTRLVEDPKNADAAADQYDVVLGFARVFDAKKDWPDAQAAYRVTMKIAVLNYVKDPSATSWRDKAEEAERASVVAGQAAESTPADPPH